MMGLHSNANPYLLMLSVLGQAGSCFPQPPVDWKSLHSSTLMPLFSHSVQPQLKKAFSE